jgi:hypothetical protein
MISTSVKGVEIFEMLFLHFGLAQEVFANFEKREADELTFPV